jgi:hypothetical protein
MNRPVFELLAGIVCGPPTNPQTSGTAALLIVGGRDYLGVPPPTISRYPRDQLRPVLSRELTDRVGDKDDERSWLDW